VSDDGALVDRVATLVTDGDARRRMGADSRRRGEAFTLAATVDRWRSILGR
jgi:hypothetical protein